MTENSSNYSFTWATQLEMGLNNLRGLDYLEAAKRVRKKGNTSVLLKTDEEFQTELAAMALGVPVADIKEKSLREYSQILNIVFNFLFGTQALEADENSED